MGISKIGGLIAAGSKSAAQPMLQVGSISVIKRIVITFQQAGIFPIIVITGAEEENVRHELAGYGVVFLQNEHPDHPELLASIKIGLRYLYGKCERVAFTPVNVPMFTPETLLALIHTQGAYVSPSYEKRGGHPVLISNDLIPEILRYSGENGMRGALQAAGIPRTWVEVMDKGTVSSVYHAEELAEQLNAHNAAILHPFIRISIEKENSFFDTRMKLLLYLLDQTHNVRTACKQMSLSVGKAWEMIDGLEKELGYFVVERRHGGKSGGRTKLTDEGLRFLQAYQSYEESVRQYAQGEFQRLFLCTNILR